MTKPKRVRAVKTSQLTKNPDGPGAIEMPVFILRQSDLPALVEQLARDISDNPSTQTWLMLMLTHALRKAGMSAGRGRR